MSTHPLDESLETSTNNLSDIIKWLKNDSYVVIHTNNGRFFHKCSRKTVT